MDTPEKNAPRPASGGGGGQPPREGKRPQGRGNQHHRRGKNRPQGNQADKRPGGNGGNNGGGKKPATPPAPAPEQRPKYATGRPNRAVHHAPDSELPNMDNLLIEDGMTAMDPAALGEQSAETDMEEIERILSYDVFADRREPIPAEIPDGKVVIVGVRFRPGGKTYFFDPGELTCRSGASVIVETTHGQEFGEVYLCNRLANASDVVQPLRPVLRLATPADIKHNQENHEREAEAFRIGVRKIADHGLDMKLVEVQYTFDNSKLLFYFTSEKRVDFRELVKDLAGVFHVRIELRQIGIRDEARMIGALGSCGRPLCCSSFLSDFGHVSMRMAKEQNLSLNASKMSGCCGRLMCCLRYEHETYVSALKSMPSVGSYVLTPDGPGMVTEVNVLKEEVKVSLQGKPDTAPKKYKCNLVEPQIRPRRPADTEARSAASAAEEEGDGEA